jgi:hypothetical protein
MVSHMLGVYAAGCVWNLMAHDAREGELANGVGSQYSHTTSECCVSSITNTDAHTSSASSRLNWCPRWFKWTHPFRRKMKSGFCACAFMFQMQSTYTCKHMLNSGSFNVNIVMPGWLKSNGSEVIRIKVDYMFTNSLWHCAANKELLQM